MTPQELKNSILQLAIQGKLVEQRAEEGTGKELLEKILAAKNAEGAKGKGEKSHAKSAKSSKVGSCFSREEIPDDEKPFEIPESWEWVRLGECCEMYTGNSISEGEKRAKYEGRKEGLDYIGTKDVSFRQTICYNNGVKIPFDKEMDFRKARAGAILLCIEGGSAGKKIAILDRDVCFGNKLCMFMPRTLLNTYLFFFLQSMEFRKVFSENMTGIIGGVSIKKLKEIVLPLPPLSEQKRIVAKIEELLPLVERYEKAWSKLKDFNKRFPADMQKSLLQMAIQGKLVEQRAEEGTGRELLEKILAAKNAESAKGKGEKSHAKSAKSAKIGLCVSREEIPDDEKPFDIPESWTWARLRDVCIADISYGIIKLGAEDQSGVKVLRCSDVKENYIDARGVRTVSRELSSQYERTLLTGGEIIINVRGTLGGCSVVPMSMAGYNVAREVAVVRQNTHMDAQYIVFILLSRYFQSFMSQGLRGIAYKGLNMGTLSNFPIPLPPLAEQKRIVAKLEELLPLCERLK